MDIKNFIEKFAETIEIDDASSLNQDTEFRDLEEWSSLSTLSLIAMLDEEFNLQIETPAFRQLKTIGDIFKYIESHK